MRGLALVALLLLAGCAQQPQPVDDSSGSTAPEPPHVDTSCPSESGLPAGAWPAPQWRVGDFWNYTTWRGADREGWENVTVAATGPVGGVAACAFHVEVRGGSKFAVGGGTGAPDLHSYAVRTLHAVWDDPECAQTLGPCSGDVAWPYDFPLWPGKSWSYVGGGDTPVLMNVTVSLEGTADSPVLDVVHAEAGDPARGETYRYSPGVGNALSWEQRANGEVVEARTLDSYRFQAEPSGQSGQPG
jgi:hypothetical protein